jgi:hypothetical protein
VRELTDLPRKYDVLDTKRRLGNLDVLFLQEVKLSRFLLISACYVIWPDGVSFASQHEAS